MNRAEYFANNDSPPEISASAPESRIGVQAGRALLEDQVGALQPREKSRTPFVISVR